MTKSSPCWRLSDFDYHLPPALIAQEPAPQRDHSRLLVSRAQGIEDRAFTDLTALLHPGDLLVINDTRVIPARLFGHKESGGQVELLLVKPLAAPDHWQAMGKSSKPLRPGQTITIAPGFTAHVVAREEDGMVHLALEAPEGVAAAIERHGHLPLPPYITRPDQGHDRERYQTVFAHVPGAVAAPTAGLHFTPTLLTALQAHGVSMAPVTLHVGLGTFQPVREEDLSRHVMHREWYAVGAETARLVNATRARGHHVVAVGTTVARTLESAADPETGQVQPGARETGLFILPGFPFRVVTRLITNFHLPRSTLLMLVAAFTSKPRLDRDYAHAIAQGYRFYSYGDAMFLES